MFQASNLEAFPRNHVWIGGADCTGPCWLHHFFSPCTTVGLLRLARCESGCQKASVGAPRWFVSKPEAACASGARPSAKEDVDATIVRCNRLADDIKPIKKFLGFTYIGDATGIHRIIIMDNGVVEAGQPQCGPL